MHPLLTFAGGLLAGIIGVRVLNKAPAAAAARLEGLGDKARSGLGEVRDGLRGAAVSGLSAVEKSSATLRGKLAPAAPAEAAPAPAAPKTAAPRRPRKVAAPKGKAKAPTPVPEGGAS